MKHSFVKLVLALSVIGVFPFGYASDSSKVVALTGSVSAATPADLLDPIDAFRPKMRIRDAFTAEITVSIAPGYYLYRDRLRVELTDQMVAGKSSKQSPAKNLASNPKQNLALSIPTGKPVDDPTFGKVDVFEGSVTLLVDLALFQQAFANGNPGKQALKVAFISQGCAAVGVCFPPQRQTFVLPLIVSGDWAMPKDGASLPFGKSGISAMSPRVEPATPVRPVATK